MWQRLRHQWCPNLDRRHLHSDLEGLTGALDDRPTLRRQLGVISVARFEHEARGQVRRRRQQRANMPGDHQLRLRTKPFAVNFSRLSPVMNRTAKVVAVLLAFGFSHSVEHGRAHF